MGNILVTGIDGFIGWHLKIANMSLENHNLVSLNLRDLDLSLVNMQSEMLIHLASKMRGDESEILSKNLEITKSLEKFINSSKYPSKLIHVNSIHTGTNTAFGRSKELMSERLSKACAANGWTFVDLILPNVFGEKSRPNHNSFLATAINSLHNNLPIEINDRNLNLVHAQDVAERLLSNSQEATFPKQVVVETTVLEAIRLLQYFHKTYSKTEIPAINSTYELKLFNSYRFQLGPRVVELEEMSDVRGSLSELLSLNGNSATVFCSTTAGGHERGNHYHREKFERFVVMSGESRIVTQELFNSSQRIFHAKGKKPLVIDIPTMTAHKLHNIEKGSVFALFGSIPKFDPEFPDTFRFNL